MDFGELLDKMSGWDRTRQWDQEKQAAMAKRYNDRMQQLQDTMARRKAMAYASYDPNSDPAIKMLQARMIPAQQRQMPYGDFQVAQQQQPPTGLLF